MKTEGTDRTPCFVLIYLPCCLGIGCLGTRHVHHTFKGSRLRCSASFLARISVSSPRKLLFSLSKKAFLYQSIQKMFYFILKPEALVLSIVWTHHFVMLTSKASTQCHYGQFTEVHNIHSQAALRDGNVHVNVIVL